MTSDLPSQRPLVLLQSAPYEGSRGRSALDLALSFAAFAQRPDLVFFGDGVLCLKAGQGSEAVGRKSLRKVIDSLPLYDVDKVFVDELSLLQNGMDCVDLPAFAVTLNSREMCELIREAGHVISL